MINNINGFDFYNFFNPFDDFEGFEDEEIDFFDGEYNAPAFDVNEQLDNWTQQGGVGDCTLIAQLYALAQTDKGKKIIDDAISVNYNDSGEIENYGVYFKGLDKSYFITPDELQNAHSLYNKWLDDSSLYSYSAGDKDMLLLELAWEKCYNESFEEIQQITPYQTYEHPKTDINQPEALDNVNPVEFYYAFTGLGFAENLNDEDYTKYDESYNTFVDSDKLENSDYIFDLKYKALTNADFATISTEEKDFYIKNNYGEDVLIYGNHSYAVKSVNDDEVTLLDPHDTFMEFTIKKSELRKYNDSFDVGEGYLTKEKSAENCFIKW